MVEWNQGVSMIAQGTALSQMLVVCVVFGEEVHPQCLILTGLEPLLAILSLTEKSICCLVGLTGHHALVS